MVTEWTWIGFSNGNMLLVVLWCFSKAALLYFCPTSKVSKVFEVDTTILSKVDDLLFHGCGMAVVLFALVSYFFFLKILIGLKNAIF